MMGDARTDGFFGPDSVAWRVLTAPATTLMIAQVTNLLEVPHKDFQAVLLGHDPLFPTNPRRQRGWRLPTAKGGHFHDRLRRTVGVPLPILFGDKRSALECAERLAHYHRPMSGVAPDGSAYRAVDPDAMLFAAVTIAHAGLRAYETFAFDGRLPRRLPAADRDAYFAEMAELAVLMGVPRERVPTSAVQIDGYYRSIAPKFTFQPGWFVAQLRTAASLLRPAGRDDLVATLGDAVLMVSALLAIAALPGPSRRLHRLPPFADPALRLALLVSMPAFALLGNNRIGGTAVRWFLGRDDADRIARARALTRGPRL